MLPSKSFLRKRKNPPRVDKLPRWRRHCQKERGKKKKSLHLSGFSRSLNVAKKTKPVWSSVLRFFWARRKKIQPQKQRKTFLAFRINSSLCSNKATNKVFSRSKRKHESFVESRADFEGIWLKHMGPLTSGATWKIFHTKKKTRKALQMQQHPLSLQQRD